MPLLKTYSIQISDYIKKGLLAGQLRPGDKVNEVHLASALCISRAPVREALQMLIKDGLIVSIPQRGKFIRTLSSQEIYDHYSLGGVLEGAAVASCADLFTAGDFEKLEDLHRQMANLKENSPEYAHGFASLDMEFHDVLMGRTLNRLMVEQARKACRRISRFLLSRHWHSAFSHREVIERYREVLDAVKSKSPGAIEAALREHYSSLGLRMSRYGGEVQ